MNRRLIRYAFFVLFAVLPLQYAFVGLMGLNGSEPWPAVVLPGFKNVWDDGDRISMPVADFRVYFEDGSVELVEPRRLFAAFPASHHLGMMRRQFCPASLSGSAETEIGRLPDTRAWLVARIAELFADRTPERIHIEWRRLEFRSDDLLPRSVPLDTLKIDLP